MAITRFTGEVKKLTSKGGRYLTPKRRKSVPSNRFLLPSVRKFPYRTPSGKVSRELLEAAIHRAAQYGYGAVERKAKRLLNTYFPKKKGKRTKKAFA